MVLDLKCHPATPATAVESIGIDHAWHSPETLWLRYHAETLLDLLFLPDPADAERADNLWQTTCFELFLREPGAAAYCEFNFSPSGQWAAYAFSDYREGMQDLTLADAPQICLDASDTHLALEVTLTLPRDLLHPDLAAAMSAVMVDTDGNQSYWALAHPPGQPDFHHADCFALELPAAKQP